MIQDMRRSPRVLLDVDAEIIDQGAPDARMAGRAHDISLGGMFVACARPAGFNARVTIRFRIPGSSEDLTLPGVVRWTREDGMGVQFGTFGVRETYAITEWVKRRSP